MMISHRRCTGCGYENTQEDKCDCLKNSENEKGNENANND